MVKASGKVAALSDQRSVRNREKLKEVVDALELQHQINQKIIEAIRQLQERVDFLEGPSALDPAPLPQIILPPRFSN